MSYGMMPVSKMAAFASNGWALRQKAIQREAYSSGLALDRHAKSAHHGSIDPQCPACNELLKKERVES